jgi:L-iditol 2-dehydrogenase
MTETMRAAVLHGQEDVRIEDVPIHRVGEGEVLLRTRAALTCGTDAKVFRRGYHARMIVPPALFGHEVSGVVTEVGPGVRGFSPGDRVVAANSAPCGACDFCRGGRANLCDDLLFWNGAYAEFAAIPARIVAKNLLHLPPHVSFAEGALVEPLACVVRGVEQSGVKQGQFVAVVGTGPIGLMFVALARLRGAEVIAAGRRETRLSKARALGARAATRVGEGDDLAAILRGQTPNGRGPDVVVEAVGKPTTCQAALKAVRKGGIVNLFAGCPAGARIEVDPARLHYEEVALVSSFHHTPDSVREALRLIAEGLIPGSAFVTDEAPLERLPAILRDMGTGEALKTAIIP